MLVFLNAKIPQRTKEKRRQRRLTKAYWRRLFTVVAMSPFVCLCVWPSFPSRIDRTAFNADAESNSSSILPELSIYITHTHTDISQTTKQAYTAANKKEKKKKEENYFSLSVPPSQPIWWILWNSIRLKTPKVITKGRPKKKKKKHATGQHVSTLQQKYKKKIIIIRGRYHKKTQPYSEKQ